MCVTETGQEPAHAPQQTSSTFDRHARYDHSMGSLSASKLSATCFRTAVNVARQKTGTLRIDTYPPVLASGVEEFHLHKRWARHGIWKVRWFGTFETVSCRVLINFLCIYSVVGRADEDELFRTHSKFWNRAELLHGVAAREAH
jgi:hypothetical protein